MKIVDDLKIAAKLAANNDKPGIALLCLRAIGVIESLSMASRDMCEAKQITEFAAAKRRTVEVLCESEVV